MDFIAFDTWTLLPSNPWYQKNSKIKNCKVDFWELLLFQKVSHLRMDTLGYWNVDQKISTLFDDQDFLSYLL
jgi:hypothetical protein